MVTSAHPIVMMPDVAVSGGKNKPPGWVEYQSYGRLLSHRSTCTEHCLVERFRVAAPTQRTGKTVSARAATSLHSKSSPNRRRQRSLSWPSLLPTTRAQPKWGTGCASGLCHLPDRRRNAACLFPRGWECDGSVSQLTRPPSHSLLCPTGGVLHASRFLGSCFS